MKNLSRAIGGLVAALALTMPAQAATATLEELFRGASITSGDKQFDRFYLVTTGPLGGSLPDASDNRTFDASKINVETLAANGSGYGIGFSVTDNQFLVNGDDLFAYADYSFGFRVTALDPTQRIVGASLGFDPGFASLSHTVDGSSDLGLFIKESIGATQGSSDISNDLSIEFSILDGALTSDYPNDVSFGPVSELWVTKNILVWSVDATDTANLQGFSQRFLQAAVPEPGSLALVALALAGLGFAGRRRS